MYKKIVGVCSEELIEHVPVGVSMEFTDFARNSPADIGWRVTTHVRTHRNQVIDCYL